MTVGAATVSWILTELLIPLVSKIQSRLNISPDRPEPDPRRYVSWSEAEKWLAQQTDADRRAPVEKQMADWRKERKRWFSMVKDGWAALALGVASFGVPNSIVVALSQWHWWAVGIVLLVPALPCLYHAWAGMPGHYEIELPELALKLFRKKLAFFSS
ncbi:hypothetical protein ABFU38_05160 [Xanthomonas campestris pv. raphani]|uniref:hypothetical protein n=1 Tax=Xanthomonas campestris TaxID=339 RepID=UPI00388FF47A